MHRRTFLRQSACVLVGGGTAWSADAGSAESPTDDSQGAAGDSADNGIGSAQLECPRIDLNTITGSASGFSARTSDGQTATLTLQPELQHCAQKLLQLAYPISGAALAVDCTTGRILACASYRRGSAADNPLVVAVPAASLFKLVTTAALFRSGQVTPKTNVCFSGGERRISRHHLEPPLKRDACPPFKTALGFSRNAVYAQLATQHLMRQQLLDQAEKLGFNRPLPFDVETSVGRLELPYNDLEFARAAAGFVGSELTPFGAAHLALTVAHQGRAARMRLVDRAGAYVAPTEATFLERGMSANTAWRLTRMMEVTVHSGTSLEAFSRPDAHSQSYLGSVRVAGKTGTLKRGKDAPTTTWFTGFAPSRKPRVAVTVMLQNAPLWRRKANEVARDMLRAYFADHRGVTHPFASDESSRHG